MVDRRPSRGPVLLVPTRGDVVRLNLELPGASKPVQTLAEISSAKEDPVLKTFATRFTFIKLPPESKELLVKFITDALAKGKTR